MSEEDLKKEIAQLKAQALSAEKSRKNLLNLLEEKEKESQEKKNFNFLQLYKNQAKELRRLGEKNSLSLNLLLLFGEKMNKQNAIMVSMNTLESITGYTRQSLGKAVRVLKNERFIKVVKVGTSNAYVVNSDVFWTSHANMKSKLSIFSATIIAGEDDQEEGYVENWKDVKLKSMPVMEQNELALDEKGEVLGFNTK